MTDLMVKIEKRKEELYYQEGRIIPPVNSGGKHRCCVFSRLQCRGR